MDKSPSTPVRVHNVAADEAHVLENRWAITQKLRLLAKKPDLITASFNGGRESVLTAVVEVLPEQNLLILDYGADEASNARLVGSERVIFTGAHNGIAAQFSSARLRRARFQGQTVFACPLPDSLLWRQRREFFRVKVPGNLPVRCEIPLPDNTRLGLPVIDLSVGGVALLDERVRSLFAADTWLQGCTLSLPDIGQIAADFCVRYMLPLSQSNPEGGQRVGCAFGELSLDATATIQRYIYLVDAQTKHLRDD
ncbi:MAG: hypothetical protein AMJ69_11640 [Gammaproteobacteria bacterium SG8_47]|nr:MAG: hypothetical protein AMJ69_11640 [Gammaproteobacteria bacterium SG8_47]